MNQTYDKKRTKEDEKLENTHYTKIWKKDLEKGLLQEKVDFDKVLLIKL